MSGWLVGGLLVVVGQLGLALVDGQSIWSLDDRALGTGPADSLAHRLAAEVAQGWIPGGAVVAAVVVLGLIVARTLVGRPWLEGAAALAAWLVTIGSTIAYLTVAFQVDYVRTPRPGLGLFAMALGAVVLTVLAVHGRTTGSARSANTAESMAGATPRLGSSWVDPARSPGA